jgi:AraC-like DNA-binding protein
MDAAGHPLIERAAIWSFREAFYEPAHVSSWYEVGYLHSGTLTLELKNGARLRARGGDFFILQPGTYHRCAHDVISPCVYLLMCVCQDRPACCPPFADSREQSAAMKMLKRAGNRVVRACPGMDAAFMNLHNEVCGQYDRPGPGPRFAWQPSPYDGQHVERDALLVPGSKNMAKLKVCLVRCLLFHAFMLVLRSIETPGKTPRYPAVRQALRFIERHLTDRMSVTQVARMAGLSAGRMTSLFREQTGETPAAYRLRLRLEKSLDRLRDQSVPVTSIAAEMAFPTSQHFSGCFKKHFGISPSAWRRRISVK